ncbi:hypothetical protein [Kineosporia babensis]|uniref:Uncharacterized protein n=1 Tax=Kineosporia babensis TaxID=499548 RepID=A0A9X1NI10_9ACTN|nr:hypothetical protein [Kineosporia babensis]MCD5315397.1 hypothetical protein [Kineosporia babensis]
MTVLIVFMVLAGGGLIGLYLRDAVTSRRISNEGNEFLETFEGTPPDPHDD